MRHDKKVRIKKIFEVLIFMFLVSVAAGIYTFQADRLIDKHFNKTLQNADN